MLARILLLLLFALSPLRAGATDFTALWWNPNESGQGYTFTQNGNFIFATFFVYDPATAPTWYTGQLTLDATGKFTGPMYSTTGPWLGTAPFNPAQVTINQVGNATFQPTAADAGVLMYNVANAQVAKNIQRQTLVPVSLAGIYSGGVAVNDTSCADPTDDGPANISADAQVTQSPTGQMQISLSVFGVDVCSFSSSGPVIQAGQLLMFPAAYTCADGSSMTATVSELRATSLGIEGRWTAVTPDGCHEEGRFSGVQQF